MFTNNLKLKLKEEKENFELEQTRKNQRIEELLTMKKELQIEYEDLKENSLLTKMKKLSIKTEMDNVNVEMNRIRPVLSDLSHQKQTQNEKLTDLTKEMDQLSHETQKEINQATYQLNLYKKLGLEFRKPSANTIGAVQVVFTQIDYANPTDEYSFLLTVTSENKFQINDVIFGHKHHHHKEDQDTNATIQDIIKQLNLTNDLSACVREMRKLFKFGLL